MKLKQPIEPATIDNIRDWAITIIVENDIESYDDGTMAQALTLSEMLEEPIGYMRYVESDEEPYVLCHKDEPGAFPIFGIPT